MRDVARLAGVGIKTVSRVINAEPNVSTATQERVRAAIVHLDYEPDMHAGSLRRSGGRTRTIGLLVGSVANPFSAMIHRAVEDVARERGVAVFASSLDEDPDREHSAVSAFLQRRVDGLILTCIGSSQAYLLAEQGRGTPMVFVDRPPHGLDADAIVADNAGGAVRATEHLIEHGHRRIAFLGDRTDIWTARERQRGYLEALGYAGITRDDDLIVGELEDERSAAVVVERLLAGPNPPTAIFSAQNLITIGALHALRARSQQREIALVGFDDVALGDLMDPGVTVVAQDAERIGSTAAKRVFERLDGATLPAERIVLDTRLIVRGSGEIPAA